MRSTSQNATHDLLLALAGRVDDDLLGWARELVAVGEDAHAVEMLTASLAADRATLPPTVRTWLVELARSARIELDVDAVLGPAAAEDATEHRFAAEEALAGPVATVLATLPARQLEGCRVLLTHRRTAAGAAPGPLPHPVLVVEVEPGTRRPDMLAYQLAVALQRSGVACSVEVLTVGGTVPAYHAEALRSARQLRLDRRAASPVGARQAEEHLLGERPVQERTAEERPVEERPVQERTREERTAESTVAVPALPTRRRNRPEADEAAEPAAGDTRGSHRLNEATQPISAAPPFGASHSDTPLFDSPTPTPPRREHEEPAEPEVPAAAAEHGEHEEPAENGRNRLIAVPTLFDAGTDEGEFHPEEFGRARRGGAAHRAGTNGSGEHEPRPAPRPKPHVLPAAVTPINRTSVTGPTPIPLLRRGANGRRPLAPVDHDGQQDTPPEAHPDGYDPLHDPLSRPLMPPLLDPTPPLTGPIGLVTPEPEPGPTAPDETWSSDWLSGSWAMPREGADGGDGDRQSGPTREVSPPRPIGRRSARHRYLRTPDEPADDPAGPLSGQAPAGGEGRPSAIPLPPAGSSGTGAIPLPPAATGSYPAPPASGAIPLPPAGDPIPMSPASGPIPLPPASGPIPLPPAGGAIPMPPATTGGPPQMPTRPAIPLPSGEHGEPDERPHQRPDDRTVDFPDVDSTLGLRPESLARLGEADLDLLAKLQAELRNGRVPRGGDHPPGPPHRQPVDGTGANGAVPRNGGGPHVPGPGTSAHRIIHPPNGHTNGARPNGTPMGDPGGVNGTGANGNTNGSTNGNNNGNANGNANGSVHGTGQFGAEGTGSHRSNGSGRNGSRLNPFAARRKRLNDQPDPDGGPPDVAG